MPLNNPQRNRDPKEGMVQESELNFRKCTHWNPMILDGVDPKMSTSLSFSGMYHEQFLICRNSYSDRLGYHQTIFMVILI